MGGKGASVSHSQPKPCSGMKTLKRCKNNGEADNVVLIDVDSDSFNNIIIIDVPENLTKKLRGSGGSRKDKRCSMATVICIDDDESTDNHHPGIGVQGDGKFSRDASSSMRFDPASSHSHHSVDAVGNQSHFDQEYISPLKLSKCKRTYSGKTSTNRYAFSTDSDSGSSDNDGPDCELEDSSGQLREQWEKASLKRKSDVHKPQSGKMEQGSASRFSTDAYQDIGVDNKFERYPEAPVCSSPKKDCYEKEGQSPSVATVDDITGSFSCDPKKSPFADTDLNSTQKTQIHYKNADIQAQRESLTESPSRHNTDKQTHIHLVHAGSSFCNDANEERRSHQGPPLSPSEQQDNKHVNLQHEDRTLRGEPSSSDSDPSGDLNFCHSKVSLRDDEAFFCQGQFSVDHDQFVVGDKDGKCEQPLYNSNSYFSCEFGLEKCSFKQIGKSDSRESVRQNTLLSDETLVNQSVSPIEKIGIVPEETFSSKCPSSGKPGICKENNSNQEKRVPIPKEPPFCNIDLDEAQLKRGKSCLVEGEKACVECVSNRQEEDEKNDLHALDGDAMPIESCIINEREKLKETDEYKRAIEEEWSSREKALKIQAEEAQHLRRLRKRRKAESMRLLDMERRQKQRVEEIRETQKKDEEDMNLKELHRTEARRELNKLEVTCHDMASLLRGLGIQVGSGLHPLPHEVRAAYKQALLSFHPDRTKGSDMHKQVEAEEKFKLISRMKDKFLPAS